MAKRQCTFDIPDNAFESLKVCLPGIVHEQTNLLNGVRNVRSGNSEVLEGADKASVECRILYRRPSGSTEFGARVCMSGEGLAGGHTGLADVSVAYFS